MTMSVGLISGMTRSDFLWGLAGYPGSVVGVCCRRLTINSCCEDIEDRDILIGHSLGGIVAKLAVVAGGARPKRVITIATPHQGVPWASPKALALNKFFGWEDRLPELEKQWPSDVELINIYGLFDFLVPPKWAVTNVGRNIRVNSGHLSILFRAKTLVEGYCG